MNDIQTIIEKGKELRKNIKKAQNYQEIDNKKDMYAAINCGILLSFIAIILPLLIKTFLVGIPDNRIGFAIFITSWMSVTFFSFKKYFFYKKKYDQIKSSIERAIQSLILTKEQLLIDELLSYDNLYKKNFYKKYKKNKKEENYGELLQYLKTSIKKVKKLEKKEIKSSNNKLQNTELEKEVNYQQYNL